MPNLSPYHQDSSIALYHGDALELARQLPDFGLRDYGVDGQYGLEDTPFEYVDTLRVLFTELRRSLTEDGTLWLNLGDSYYSGRGNPGPGSADTKQAARRGWVRPQDRCGVEWATPKNLLGIPWRVAFALQDDGWILRNDVIWHKPNAMPESVIDRLSTRYEHVFMFSKSRRYFFDLDAIREESVTTRASALTWHRADRGVPGQKAQHRRGRPDTRGRGKASGAGVMPNGSQHTASHSAGKNPGDVWSITTVPFAGAHFAAMPPALAQRCVLAGCKPGGTVLDPFSGSGTTGLAAQKLGRKYVGFDINKDYLDLSLSTKLRDATLDFGETAS